MINNRNYQIAVRIAQISCYLLLVSSIFTLILGVQNNSSGRSILYAGGKLLFVSGGIILGKIRKSHNYYFAVFYEMNELLFWYLVIACTNVLTLIYAYFSTSTSSELQTVNASGIVLFLISMVIFYQIKPWTRADQDRRLKRIRKLAQKARLSESELAILAPVLADTAQQKQKMPLAWRIAKWISVLVLSILLNIYASAVVDFLGKIDVLKSISGH